MGHKESKERGLFIDIAKHILHKRGISVSSMQLRHFFHFIHECCPWFPEEGTLNLETWKKLGKEMKVYYDHHGPEKIPVDAFALWNVFKDALDPTHEAVCLARQVTESEQTPLIGAAATSRFYKTTSPQKQSQSNDEQGDEEEDEQLSPQDQEDLEEAAARYHISDWPPNLLVSVSPEPP